MTKLSTKRGAILIFTFIIMVTLSAMTVAFLYMTSSRARASAYDVASAQAFWAAEAGLQQVIYQLGHDSDYRDSPTTVTGSLGQGSYSAEVSVNGTIYTITSTGTVSVLNRSVQESVDVSVGLPDAFDYAVFGNTNSNRLKLEDNTAISGDLYYDGDVEVKTNASVTNGLVYADSVSGEGSYTEAPGPPNPVPTYPTFDTTFYDNEISTADTAASSNLTLSGNDTLELAGATVYYKKVTIKDNARITGSGTIVATKDVKIEDSANITSGVTIIGKKKVKVKDDAVVSSGGILYSRTNIILSDDADVTGTLIAPEHGKKVKMEDDAVLTGIIYAYKVELKDNSSVTGSVVANEYKDNKIKDDASVTFDQNSLPSAPTGMEAGDVTITSQNDWDEIPPSS